MCEWCVGGLITCGSPNKVYVDHSRYSTHVIPISVVWSWVQARESGQLLISPRY